MNATPWSGRSDRRRVGDAGRAGDHCSQIAPDARRRAEGAADAGHPRTGNLIGGGGQIGQRRPRSHAPLKDGCRLQVDRRGAVPAGGCSAGVDARSVFCSCLRNAVLSTSPQHVDAITISSSVGETVFWGRALRRAGVHLALHVVSIHRAIPASSGIAGERLPRAGHRMARRRGNCANALHLREARATSGSRLPSRRRGRVDAWTASPVHGRRRASRIVRCVGVHVVRRWRTRWRGITCPAAGDSLT